jgi:hypothetical protein
VHSAILPFAFWKIASVAVIWLLKRRARAVQTFFFFDYNLFNL